MTRALAAIALLWSLAAAAASARAQSAEAEPQPVVPVWDRAWLAQAELGIGTPIGLIGVQLERRLGAAVALRGGLGWNGYSVQGAGMVRVRLPQAPALNLGAGISGGRFRPLCIMCDDDVPTWDLAFFNNYELSAEARARTGFTFRAYAGLGWLMNPGAYECPDCGGDPPSIPVSVPYCGISLGTAF